MSKTLGCVAVALALCVLLPLAAVGAEVYPLTFPGTGAGTLANARGLAVGPDGTIYVVGAARPVGTTNNAASYWTLSGGVLSAANLLPTTSGGTTAAQGLGIGVLANGTVAVAANMSGGASDWTSAPGQGNNGWAARNATGSNQAVVGGQANQIRINADGTRYYNLGRTPNNSTTGFSFDIDGATRAGVKAEWSLSTAASSNSVQGISTAGRAAGELRNPDNTIRRAYVADTDGTVTFLPGVGRPNEYAQAYAISADGNTVGGLGFWDDTTQGGAYWTNSGGTWTSHQLGRVADFASSAVAYGVNQDGSILVGRDSPGVRGEVAVFWKPSELDGTGRPAAVILKDWLMANGVDMSDWSELGRPYSVVTVGALTYIAGDGAYYTDATHTTTYTRGWVTVIPEPATLALFGFALLGLRARRR